MKTLILAIVLIVWMVLTLVLACTIIGIMVIIEGEWGNIGSKLTDKILE